MDLQAAPAYRTEQFQLDFSVVYTASLGDNRLPGHRGWVLAPECWLRDETYEVVDLWSGMPVPARQVTLVNNPVWQRRQLAVARYSFTDDTGRNEPHVLLARFRQALVDEQIRVIRAASNWCREFLASRTIGTQTLGSHPAVAQVMAALVRDVYALNAGVRATQLDTPGWRAWLIDEVDSIGEQLIKLAGGRAMLDGQMVYLRTLLLTLNRLYLEE